MEFRRWNLFDIDENMCELTEGVTPDGQTLSQSTVEAEVSQYGAYVEISDLLEQTAYEQVLSDSAELLGEQLGTVVEWVTRDADVCRQQHPTRGRQERAQRDHRSRYAERG